MKKLESFSKLLPLATLFLILCSSAQLIIFYNFFNINIVNYLNSEEYLTLFIDDILYYLSIFGIGLFGYMIDNNETQKNHLKHNKLSKGIFFLLFGVCLGLIVYILQTELPDSNKATLIGVLVFFFVFFLYLYLSLTSLDFSYPIFIAVAILVYSISDSVSNANKIIELNQSVVYKFVYKNKIISTSCNFLYLGTSKDYLFFYSPEKKESVIYRNSNIEKIVIKDL